MKNVKITHVTCNGTLYVTNIKHSTKTTTIAALMNK